ncbi:MAG TPA: dockerin type I domain-containing protein, partial [Lacipirellulaceae bacterium]|nr:dockerin type I domain-containing protein [Lacipirellulaceae bacterium]
PAVNEGIPSDGNTIDSFESQTHQTFFEGRHTDGADPNDPADDTNVNFNVMVGTTSYGSLLISGESALRDENLYIGGQGTINGTTRFGTGIVRITGFGSLYNNDPNILPAEVQNIPGGFSSQTPRPTDQGFDMYVGQFGNGTLEITAGARAEIQDAVLIGDAPGSTGNIVVDGIDSFLGNGGFEASGTGDTDVDQHQMTIGFQGTGTMTISGGATVVSQAPIGGAAGSNTGTVGAVLGGTPFTNTLGTFPDAGGSGTVTVTGTGSTAGAGSTAGTASTWSVGGSLQVGGFDIGLQGMTIGSVKGEDLPYPSQTGHGTLNVAEGGLVTIQNALDVDPTDITTPLLLAIGRFGIVSLSGGTIQVGSVNTQQGGTGNQGTPDAVQVINDGVIMGSGTIRTGVFRNRYLGQVRVNAGDSLLISSSSQFTSGTNQTPPDPLINYGLVEVLGTRDSPAQLEFERAPTTPLQPFINRPVFLPPNPTKFIGGMISAKWAIVRSGSGIQNEGVMAFTEGTNIIQAHVDQIVGPTGFVPVFSIGPNTSVVVEDDCLGCAPTFVGGGNTLQVLDPGTWTSNGTITMQLSLSNPNLISAAGDIGISGAINLTLASDVLADLAANGPGQSYQIISFTGGAYQTTPGANGAPLPDYSKPLPDCSGIPTCVVPGLGVVGPNLSALLGPSFNNVVPVAQRIGESIMISFLNPTTGGAMGPDFNGDGVVDGLDLAIWKQNVGIPSGATVLQGDANGDGRVDGADFLIWQRNFGKPQPWLGSGSGGSLAAVPEPTSGMMLICGALAVAFSRRPAKKG